MKKRMLSLFLAIVLSLGAVALSAAAVDLPVIPIGDEPESVWEYTVSGDNVTVTGYNGTKKTVVVPAVLGTKSVVAIGARAFYNKTSITKITLPAGIKTLGDGAFENCVKISSFVIPSGVTSIGEGCFRGCRKLAEITVPDGVTSVSPYCFADCAALYSVELPAGLRSVGEGAFSECAALDLVVFGGTGAEWRSVAIADDNMPLLAVRKVFSDSPEPNPVGPGDVDGDGRINARDVLGIMRYIVGYRDLVFDASYADFDGDGNINSRDVIALILAIVNGEI